ncbi:MAG TPA: hypothetical protein PK079_06105 [Leptospiraceae bacterium]|nr:hypothetical protein [Leptospiraceae bacterium]HMX32482.1 hypothetical protein [Leptospiraceae bacterium]HMY30216.1 hypothetical protein [Leptospiraceae bacterium]HMZ67175.1 hypothetical protein [Leptospiraceae bacterium]HNA07205.1 hypothetical protein [Leptospiraceae bacterium]
MTEKKSKIIWEEFSFSEYTTESNVAVTTPKITKVQMSSLETENPDRKSLKSKAEILDLKQTLKTSLSDSYDLTFIPEKFIQTNLLGEISFKRIEEIQFRSNYLIQAKSEQDQKAISSFERIISYYDKEFIEDVEILEIVSTYLIQMNRLADLVALSNKFLSKGILPLKFQIFFILTGIYENNLTNLVLSGNEKIIINILYKFKFLQIDKSEKNYLYDLVVSGLNPELVGIVFQLFKDDYKGIRNISPVYKIISEKYKYLSREEKRAFVNSYEKTYNYLKTYFYMKQSHSDLEIQTWLKAMKVMNGKDAAILDTIDQQLKDVPEKLKLNKKYLILKEHNASFLLNPFEILLLCNSTVALELKNEIADYYEKYPNSFIANRSIAVTYFHEEDYKKFLMQIAQSGNFRYQMEVLYLKAIAYRELNLEKESSKIFQALYKRFPESEILAKEMGLV